MEKENNMRSKLMLKERRINRKLKIIFEVLTKFEDLLFNSETLEEALLSEIK